jgi:2'-5' RNA ligase
LGYAVELYFDSQTEKRVWELRQLLIEHGIASLIGGLGDRPHVSLAVFPEVDCNELISVTKEYANGIEPFDVQFSAIGSFPTIENVLFLSPVLTEKLLDHHSDFHHMLVEAKLTASAYYLPGNWTPHCTVEMNIPDEQFSAAREICKKSFIPFTGQFQEIGVTEFRPIQRLANWSLLK